jgi:hypothetical protein
MTSSRSLYADVERIVGRAGGGISRSSPNSTLRDGGGLARPGASRLLRAAAAVAVQRANVREAVQRDMGRFPTSKTLESTPTFRER